MAPFPNKVTFRGAGGYDFNVSFWGDTIQFMKKVLSKSRGGGRGKQEGQLCCKALSLHRVGTTCDILPFFLFFICVNAANSRRDTNPQ